MKTPDLITWDASTKNGKFDSSPRISFGKSGIISINLAAQRLLELKDGDYIVFHQDRNEPSSWWIEKSTPGKGIKVRSTKSGSKALLANWSIVVKAFLSSVKQNTGCRVLVGTECVASRYELITSALKS